MEILSRGMAMVEAPSNTALNISASTVVLAVPGTIKRINVISCLSTAGAVHDCATVGAATAANKIATIPAAVGIYEINMPCSVGIVVIPGALQVFAVHYA